MNIYLLEQNVVYGYGAYNSMVVIAESAEEASQMHPVYRESFVAHYKEKYGAAYNPDEWCAPEDVKVTLLGSSNEDTSRIVISSRTGG